MGDPLLDGDDDGPALVVAAFMAAYGCSFDEAVAALTGEDDRVAVDVRRRRDEYRRRAERMRGGATDAED